MEEEKNHKDNDTEEFKKLAEKMDQMMERLSKLEEERREFEALKSWEEKIEKQLEKCKNQFLTMIEKCREEKDSIAHIHLELKKADPKKDLLSRLTFHESMLEMWRDSLKFWIESYQWWEKEKKKEAEKKRKMILRYGFVLASRGQYASCGRYEISPFHCRHPFY